MRGTFDPYYTWLGIPPEESAGGPNHYRLLGITLFEANPSVIDHAADRILIHLRTLSSGPHAAESQRLMNEAMTARICLLDPSQRQQYDALLRKRLGPSAGPSATPSAALRMPVAVPTAPAIPKAAQPQRPVAVRPVAPVPLPKAQPLPVEPQPAASPVAPLIVDTSAAPARRPASRRKDDGANMPMALVGIVKVVIGGLGGLSLALLIVWVFFRSDPLGLFATESSKATARNNKKAKVVVERPGDRPSTGSVNSRGPARVTPSPVGSSAAGDLPGSSSKPATAASDDNPPMPMPASVEPPESPQPAPPPPPAAVAAQLPTRLPQPTQAEQQAKLAELKEIYKSEFDASTRPGTREVFPDFLLATADKLKSDPVARFVLFREAFTRLIAAKQFDTAVTIVDRLDQEFALDPFTLRVHTLTKASEAARLPADKVRIVLCASELADLAMGRQRLPEATSLARMADGQARGLPDGELKNRIGALRAEVEKAAEQWGPVERARQTLATDPSDAAAATVDGRYRCLVQGDWQTGLELLARGSDQQLAAAAQQDLAGPAGEVSAEVLGDNWYALAESESKLVGFHARARHWYRQSIDRLSGLDKLRVEERIRTIEGKDLPERLLAEGPAAEDEPLPSFAAMFSRSPSFQPVDLFSYVRHNELIASPWDYASTSSSAERAVNSDRSVGYGRLPAHFTPPREYQMSLQVIRYRSTTTSSLAEDVSGPLVLGLVGPRGPFAAVIDLPLGNEFVSSLALAGAKGADDNPTLTRHSGPLIRPSFGSISSQVVCQVRRNSVTVLVNGQTACQYEGDQTKLTMPREWRHQGTLMLGAHLAAYNVRGWRLDPLPKEAPSSAVTPPQPGQPFTPGFASQPPERPLGPKSKGKSSPAFEP
jgi:hypothetical protein